MSAAVQSLEVGIPMALLSLVFRQGSLNFIIFWWVPTWKSPPTLKTLEGTPLFYFMNVFAELKTFVMLVCLKLFKRYYHSITMNTCPIYIAHIIFSWHLQQILCDIGFQHTKHDLLQTMFAAQLANCGLWKWSIFVLLHLKDTNRYCKHVKNYWWIFSNYLCWSQFS